MLRRNGKVVLALSILVVLLISTLPACAQRQIRQTHSNIDPINRTGQLANDFEWFLPGVMPADVAWTYTQPNPQYPSVQKVWINGGTLLQWTGSSTSPGQSAHFGVTVNGNRDPRTWTYDWTYNGFLLPIRPPRLSQAWRYFPGGRMRDVIINSWEWNAFVQRRVIVLPRRIALEELMRAPRIMDMPLGEPSTDLWNAATVIDQTPVMIAPGGELTYDFVPTDGVTYGVFYDVFDDQGEMLMTYMNAAEVSPEPSSLLVLAGGLGMLGGIMRRRKR